MKLPSQSLIQSTLNPLETRGVFGSEGGTISSAKNHDTINNPRIDKSVIVTIDVLFASLNFFSPSSVVKSYWQCLHFSAHFLIFSLHNK